MAPRKKTTAKQAKLPFPKSKPKSRTITPSKAVVRKVTTKPSTIGTSVAKPTKSTGNAVKKINKSPAKKTFKGKVINAKTKQAEINSPKNSSKFDSLLKRIREFANNGDSGKAQKFIKSAINSDLKKADATVTRAARASGLSRIPPNIATTLFQGLSRKGILGLATSAILIGSAIYANSDDEEKIVKKAKSIKKMPEAKEVKELPEPKALKNKPEPEKKTKISDSDGREDAKEKNETPKRKPLEQGRRKIGDTIVDSTDEGMSKFMGSKEEIRQQMDEDEMNFRKGGTPSKRVYGARAGGFTKRGGMYKKGY